jgi:hypothetical protein
MLYIGLKPACPVLCDVRFQWNNFLIIWYAVQAVCYFQYIKKYGLLGCDAISFGT